MIERKPLLWFILIAFAISWPLFMLPLALQGLGPALYQTTTVILWAAAMWGPGAAAIICTVLVAKKPFRTLNLNRLGPKRFYLWAWFLPTLLSVAAGLFTLLLGLGELDTGLTTIQSSLTGVLEAGSINPWIIAGAQGLFALTLAPFINMVFALGEELGWRAFLLPRLLPLGEWPAILITGLIWGIWHAPAVLQGLNYPGHPAVGILMMMVFCILLGTILSWLYLKTKSPWAPALGHGAVNAVAGLPVLFLKPGIDMAFGGTLASVAGWIGIAVFVLLLVIFKQLPLWARRGQATGS